MFGLLGTGLRREALPFHYQCYEPYSQRADEALGECLERRGHFGLCRWRARTDRRRLLQRRRNPKRFASNDRHWRNNLAFLGRGATFRGEAGPGRIERMNGYELFAFLILPVSIAIAAWLIVLLNERWQKHHGP
jgi:hypothetical protein